MAYIAIRNTEHKGVYKEKEFNKEILKTKGISSRKFEDAQYEDALKWAGVKDVKTNTSNKKSTNKKVNEAPTKVEETSFAFKSIEEIKKQGYSAVCITLKNNTEIIAKIDDSYILKRNDRINFDDDKTTVENIKMHINNGVEHIEKYGSKYYYYTSPKILNYDMELIKIKNNTTYKNISNDCIFLDNFWVRRISDNCDDFFGEKKLLLSRMIKIDGYKGDLWKSYKDLYLNTNEISLIKPLAITLPGNYIQLGQTSGSSYCRNVSKKEALEIDKIYKDTLSKYDVFRDIIRTEINK